LARLQHILFYRELRFPLSEIKELLDHSDSTSEKVLLNQRQLLLEEQERISTLITTITTTLANRQGIITMHDQELFEGLSHEQLEEYAIEAKERWGDTKAYQQSQERMKHWSKEDMARIKTEQQAQVLKLAELMSKGVESPEVQEIIDQNYKFINEMFYDCSLEMFEGLACLKESDDRFAEYYRKIHPDLPDFHTKAVLYYCQNQS